MDHLASMAELERATMNERMTMGRDRVASQGQYTGGAILTGYDLDDERRLVPSARIVPQLAISEADLIRGIFTRIANGESTLGAEAARLTALGIPRRQRYGGDRCKTIERTAGWDRGSLAAIVHNPTYKGCARVRSRHGTIGRPTTALVTPDVWDRAQQALLRNRSLSKKNAKRDYLLRGLVKCAWGMSYSGASGSGRPVYRCTSNAGGAHISVSGPCGGKQIDAAGLEDAVWKAARAFIDHPDEYIADAQQQLRDRLATASEGDAQRKRLAAELAGKEHERERVLGMFRRGRITADEAERELDAIAAEAAQIRELIDSLRVRVELAAAQEAYLSDVGVALARMRGRVEEIERTDDRQAKRQLIELLVPRIVIRTEFAGTTPTGRRRKRAKAHLTLAFAHATAVVSITQGRCCRSTRW
jgi:site-specific DNA recombinase